MDRADTADTASTIATTPPRATVIRTKHGSLVAVGAGAIPGPFSFAHFAAYPARNELVDQQRETTHRLEPRTMQVLILLATNTGDVVTREAFAEVVWAGRRVVTDSLSQCISELRALLDDNARNPEYIRTLPKRGYCFLQPVDWQETHTDATTEAPIETSVTGRTRFPFRRSLTGLWAVGLLLIAAISYRHSPAEPPPSVSESSRISASLSALLSPSSAATNAIVLTGPQQSDVEYRVERKWLDDSRAMIQLLDSNGTVLWRAEHSTSTEVERSALSAELSAVLNLADSQQNGTLLTGLPIAEAKAYRLAKHHLDRRTLEDLEHAQLHVERVLARNPDSVDALLLMAEIHRAKARHDRSMTGAQAHMTAFEALIDQASVTAGEHPAVQAMNYRPSANRRNWAEDEKTLFRLVEEAPDCTGCVRQLSGFYEQVGWFEEALSVWEAHKRFWPLSVEVHANIARIHASMGNAREALAKVALIKALAGNEAWDVTSTELNAYQLLNQEDRWYRESRRLMASLGARGQRRQQVLDALREGDEEQLQIFALGAEEFTNPHMAILLNRTDLLVTRLEDEIAKGNYLGFGTLHGMTWQPNPLNRRYLDGLNSLRRHPRVQQLIDQTGLSAFWESRGKLPDLCHRASQPPPYCG